MKIRPVECTLSFSGIWRFLGLALCVLCVQAAKIGGLPTAQEEIKSQPATTLELNRPLDREISVGQRESYQIRMDAGEFASVSIEQLGVDIFERVFGPEGKLDAEFNDELQPQESERAEFVAETAGLYRLEIAPRFNHVGRYRIRLTDVHRATDHDRMLHNVHNLVTQIANLDQAGKYDDALLLAERALKVADEQLEPGHPYAGRMFNELGHLYLERSNFTKARELYQRALVSNQKTLGPEHPQTAESMKGLAEVYGFLNEFQKGEELIQQALQVIESVLGMDHPWVGRYLFTMANVHQRRGDLTIAEQEYKRVIAIAEENLDPDFRALTRPLNNLSLLYNTRKEYDRAEPLLERVIAILDQDVAQDSREFALPLQNLGLIVQEKRKDYPRALDLYWRAVHILEKSDGEENPRVASILNNIANIYKSQGDYPKSLDVHQRVYSMFAKSLGPYHSLTLVSAGNIARTYASMGDVQNAIKYQTLTDEIIEKNLVLNLAIGSERQKLAFFDSLADRTDRTISLHVDMAPADPAARDLALLAILQRKGRVIDAMALTLSALRQRLKTEDQELLGELNTTTARLANLELNGRGETALEEFRQEITTLEVRKENLESEISRRSAEFRAQTQVVTLAGVQAAIPREAALIEFAMYRPFNGRLDNVAAYGERRYIAYVVRQTGEVKWKDLGPAKDIDAAIEAFREATGDPRRTDSPQRARTVYEKVMQPVRTLVGDAAQLLISPDGELNRLPFAALVDGDGRYLVQHYLLTYLTSGRDLLRMRIQHESMSKPLIIADPAFGEPVLSQTAQASTGSSAGAASEKRRSITSARTLSDVYFGPLDGTALEGRAIQGVFPEAHLLMGSQATKTTLMQSNSPRLLHLATHGFFLSAGGPAPTISNPLLRSGLALAGANVRSGKGDDGILTSLEASGLNLWGTKLVVLSACDTGLGDVRNGEGVYGLRRSFLLAGAESLVMSLSPISDYWTRELMTGYYKNLKQGMGRGAALRQVQLDTLRKNPKLHPFYWANFIQSGDWTALDADR